ncbi:MAG: HDOD domain-containing protein [Proteobacteria bacterium]|nr:HDOD domain-containing protein [Pseudomonadota bacterium]
MIKDLKKRLEGAINLLPPIPAVMVELLRALDDENSDINSLARIISKDPSMSINVLKVANSAFYRLPYKVSAIDHAVRMLGIKEITMICIACGAYGALKPPRGAQTFDTNRFWKHSVATAVIAKRLCNKMNMKDLGAVYLSGLLHDVGKIILDRFVHEIYEIVINATSDECISMIEAEKKFLGETHDIVGGWIMEQWKLPEIFIDVARYHHCVQDSTGENKTAVAVCSLADQLARIQDFGFGGDISGVILNETEAFKVLEKVNPKILEIDMVKFNWDLENADDEIGEMESILKN